MTARPIARINIVLANDTTLADANDMFTEILSKYGHLVRTCEVELK